MQGGFKNVLVCVAGATPQVITETIYALATKTAPVFINELYIITTAYGRDVIKKRLLDDGILLNLLKEYNLPHIEFTEDNIVVIKDINGKCLDDIKNDKENESTGDIITDFVRKMCERSDIALHCSIAGGRKTMSFYLGAALQLFGRPQDRLYHVLVSPEFENNPDFFYPPKRPVKIRCRLPEGEKLISTSRAEIHLADLPFLRLKDNVFLEKTSFRELIKEAQKDVNLSVSHLPLTVDLHERKLIIGNHEINLQPMKLAIYTLFAYKKRYHCLRKERPICADCDACYISVNKLKGKGTLSAVKKINESIYGKNSSRMLDGRWGKYEKQGFIKIDTIRQYIRKINAVIEEQIEHPELYVIKSKGGYGSKRYGIRADKNRIFIKLL